MSLWGEHLRGLTDTQIEQACRAMVTEYPSWPPTLGEFLALAQGRADHTPEYYEPPVYKPLTAEAKARAKALLDELKRALAEQAEGRRGE